MTLESLILILNVICKHIITLNVKNIADEIPIIGCEGANKQ